MQGVEIKKARKRTELPFQKNKNIVRIIYNSKRKDFKCEIFPFIYKLLKKDKRAKLIFPKYYIN